MSTDNTDETVNNSNNNDHVAYIVANLQVLIPRWLEKYGYDYPIVVLDTSNWDWDNFVSFCHNFQVVGLLFAYISQKL